MRLTLATVAACAAVAANAATVFVECESFQKKGGWSVDQQFMDQMGSPYLIAHGVGTPVADAETAVAIPEAAKYTIWARTRNWNAKWANEPAGKFRIALNNVELDRDLGTEGDEWAWQKVSELDLDKGPLKVALKDQTGFDGRCDAIVFSSDAGWAPPAGAAELSRFRRQVGALRLSPEMVDADIVVVGGGIAGTCAAVSAARLGLRVALVHDRPMVGGCNSSEVRVHLGGRINIGEYKKLGDVVAEIGPAKGGNARPAEQYEDARKMEALAAEPNVMLFANTHVTRVETMNRRGRKTILSVYGQNIETGVETRFSAALFADCTGDGNLGALAGAEFRYGRESKEETGEKTAVDKADSQTMGASVQWNTTVPANPDDAKFPDIGWALPGFNDATCQKLTFGDWNWETGMRQNQVDDAEHIRDYGLLVVYSNWNFIKNRANPETRAKFAPRKLDWVAYIAGKRESRRLMGDYVLRQQDIEDRVKFEDGTCCTSWTIDLHYPDEKNEKDFPGAPFMSHARHIKTHYYPIPYRCLYSRNIENMFMAGRNISVTHVALGTVRVMRTTGMMGEVVGMAAALCKANRCMPRGVYEKHLGELKELMGKGVGKGLPQPPQHYNEGSSLSAH